ncbi:cytochrome C [Hylemonella gracilis]|uniref:Cytochrome C n=1 Tax=Hylemonella gracilis TaxID=80880 RepID=A0A4P6UEZ3_9BURK|nr:c-type cytochrome [Hylemonella gracilis]QBK03592.1 cytochrome C [Hylemonella gracilis]
MSSCRDLARLCVVLCLSAAGVLAWAQQPSYPGLGRTATPQEVRAWDIDVRPDFKGLPKGTGSVSQGQDVWEAKCASCHGVFGESNQVFNPLVGGTNAQDVARGRVARLTDTGFPGRTTLMKVPTVSTLWDYINRAMPWNAPKTLKTDEVYALVAFLLNLGDVVPADFVLSDANIAEVQKRMPNRDGMTTDHGLWPGKGLGNGGMPDVKAVACMKDCVPEPKVASLLPDFARNNHGNLAEQQRGVGPQRGADTTQPASAASGPPAKPAASTTAQASGAASAATVATVKSGAQVLALAQKYTCTACHGTDNKIVGPSFKDVAAKYAKRTDAKTYLAGKIRAGGQGVWGPIPMPAQTLPDADLQAIAAWLASGAPR